MKREKVAQFLYDNFSASHTFMPWGEIPAGAKEAWLRKADETFALLSALDGAKGECPTLIEECLKDFIAQREKDIQEQIKEDRKLKGCTCPALETERTMHNAWRKRAEEAERAKGECPTCGGIRQVLEKIIDRAYNKKAIPEGMELSEFVDWLRGLFPDEYSSIKPTCTAPAPEIEQLKADNEALRADIKMQHEIFENHRKAIAKAEVLYFKEKGDYPKPDLQEIIDFLMERIVPAPEITGEWLRKWFDYQGYSYLLSHFPFDKLARAIEERREGK